MRTNKQDSTRMTNFLSGLWGLTSTDTFQPFQSSSRPLRSLPFPFFLFCFKPSAQREQAPNYARVRRRQKIFFRRRFNPSSDPMDQHYNPRTVEEVFRDFKGRRAGIIRALTTGRRLIRSKVIFWGLEMWSFEFFCYPLGLPRAPGLSGDWF